MSSSYPAPNVCAKRRSLKSAKREESSAAPASIETARSSVEASEERNRNPAAILGIAPALTLVLFSFCIYFFTSSQKTCLYEPKRISAKKKHRSRCLGDYTPDDLLVYRIIIRGGKRILAFFESREHFRK